MELKAKRIKGLYELLPKVNRDERGFVARLYDDKIFEKHGLNIDWKQETHFCTQKKNVVKGLHIQFQPYTELKMIRAAQGSTWWVAVDLREGSETFGQWEGTVLSEELQNSLYAEPGFAHGCLSLTDRCSLVVKINNYFEPDHGWGINWKDPELNIQWPLDGKPVITERDDNYPSFNEFKRKHGHVKVKQLVS